MPNFPGNPAAAAIAGAVGAGAAGIPERSKYNVPNPAWNPAGGAAEGAVAGMLQGYDNPDAYAPKEERKRGGVSAFDRERTSNVLQQIGQNENQFMNTLASMEGIEGANMVPLELERYQYQDLSEPLRADARRQRAIGRSAIQQGIGSRGQQTSYLTQNDAAVQEAFANINDHETGRKLDVYNQNVGLSNAEIQAGMGEQLRVQDILRRQRAARRKFGQEGTAERTKKAYIHEQTNYLKSRDARLMEIEQLKASKLGTPDFSFGEIYDKNGRPVKGAGISYKG